MDAESEKRLAYYLRNGWAPVKYAHQPAEIKAELRRIGMRPQMKQCFANCQRFIVQSALTGLEYHEGYITAIIPLEHAWLTWDGERIDLTLAPNGPHPITYHGSTSYSRDDVLANVMATGLWAVLDYHALNAQHPMAAEMAKIWSRK